MGAGQQVTDFAGQQEGVLDVLGAPAAASGGVVAAECRQRFHHRFLGQAAPARSRGVVGGAVQGGMVEQQQRGVGDGPGRGERHRAEFVEVAEGLVGHNECGALRAAFQHESEGVGQRAAVVAAYPLAQPLCLGFVQQRGVYAGVVNERAAHPAGGVGFALCLFQPCVRVGGRV